MFNRIFSFIIVATVLFSVSVSLGETKSEKLLWEIGSRDNDTSEFAMGPKEYGQYSKYFEGDPIYLVGRSTPAKDWSYWHPGPVDDGSSGNRSHSFVVLFDIVSEIQTGDCEFVIDMVDTHKSNPPMIEISINGNVTSHQLKTGNTDDSIFGDPSKGKESVVSVPFPSSYLRKGSNEIVIKTLRGSWFLYDWVGLYTPKGFKYAPPEDVTKLIAAKSGVSLKEINGVMHQTIDCYVLNFGKNNTAVLKAGNVKKTIDIKDGINSVDFLVPAVEKPENMVLTFIADGKATKTNVELNPLRKWEIYLLPHSHVDLGYTHKQEEVIENQKRFIDESIEMSKASSENPDGSVYKWNAEVLLAVENYLQTRTDQEIEDFIDAVKRGWIGLDALYGSQHTGLARPEELFQTVQFACELREKYDVTIDTAMITDVPGYTWGMVPALVQSGVKYMSWAPNGGDHLGLTRSAWDNKPFYWISPSGKEKLLCWQTNNSYYPGFHNADQLKAYIRSTEKNSPDLKYDMLYLRHTTGDNGGPSKGITKFVEEWNSKYDYPKLIIATTSELFHKFEERYGDQLPEYRGDFSPYWEDGAASTARETAINRNAAERLVQAEKIWAMVNPSNYPAASFKDAWRNVLLYTEHTWGANVSISQPDSSFTKSQWAWKANQALEADRLSKELLNKALDKVAAVENGKIEKIQVFNTLSWPRTDIVTVEGDLRGEVVKDEDGKIVPSQKVNEKKLVFLAENIPAMGSRYFSIHSGAKQKSVSVQASETTLRSRNVLLELDPGSGVIRRLNLNGLEQNLVNSSSSIGLNKYCYVLGDDAETVSDNQVEIEIKESGPLFSTLLITSQAPGCNSLKKEITLYEYLDRIDVKNILDRKKVREHEGVHIGFDFDVPNGKMLVDIPWAIIDPMVDQLPGANSLFLCMNRWLDISNNDYGVTWVSLDAPIIEKGDINVKNFYPDWSRELSSSNIFYSYVMNNYWWTNFKADQEGVTEFRYSIKPHLGSDVVKKQKFGISISQPLIAVAVTSPKGESRPLFEIDNQNVIITSVKPADNGNAYIVRFFNGTGQNQSFEVRGPDRYETYNHGMTTSAFDWPIRLESFGIFTAKIVKK